MAYPKPVNIDEYIAAFPHETQGLLNKVRTTILRAAPGAGETISYAIPTFTINGKYLVYMATFKHHISIYPAPRNAEEFKKELAAYKGGKGTVQFPLDKPIPYKLITRIVKYRLKERMLREKPKKAAVKKTARASR